MLLLYKLMSNKEIANRIHAILTEKAMMGMGYNMGEGRPKGSKNKKKSTTTVAKKNANPWVQYLKEYASKKGITYSEALSSNTARSQYKKVSQKTKSKKVSPKMTKSKKVSPKMTKKQGTEIVTAIENLKRVCPPGTIEGCVKVRKPRVSKKK